MERAIICGYFDSGQKDGEIQDIMAEMRALAETAGAETIAVFAQRKPAPDRRYLIGLGKAEEIRAQAQAQQADLIIFFNVLSAMQQRNLEDFFELKVVDRTRLILDIFALHARSMEGKLQVELAQHLYLLPRLTGKGTQLSRLGGGIGTRGPGETKLETDRRVIKKRISLIRRRLHEVMRSREIQRRNRNQTPAPVVSLVGYTSAGKSTLFQALTGTDVVISPLLFSTLDPLMRRVPLDEIEPGYHFLLSDTVGFIRSMPHELFTSFQATLEEVVRADLLLHVIDTANPDFAVKKQEVERILGEMDIPRDKVIPVYNKIDLLPEGSCPAVSEKDRGIYVSAAKGWGLLEVKRRIFQEHFRDFSRYTLRFPAPEFNPEALSRWAIILEKSAADGFICLEVLCSRENMLKFKEKHGGAAT